MQFWSNVMGISGVVLINIAYLLLNTGQLKVTHWAFPLINFVGASLIVYSICIEWNLPAFLMEMGWAAISLYGFVHAIIKKLR